MPALQQPSSWLSRKGPGKWQHWWGEGSHGCFVAGAQPRSCPSLPAKLLGANPQCPAQKPHPKSQAWLALLFWHVKKGMSLSHFHDSSPNCDGPVAARKSSTCVEEQWRNLPLSFMLGVHPWQRHYSFLKWAVLGFFNWWNRQQNKIFSHIDKKGKGRKQKLRATFWSHPCQHPTGHQPGCRTSKNTWQDRHRYTRRNGWSMPGWPHRSGAKAWQKVGRTAKKIHKASNKRKGMLLEQRVTCNGKPFTLHMPLFLFWS